MEKSCKNCIYRDGYYCTKIGEEITNGYVDMAETLDENLNCTELAEDIVEKLGNVDVLNTDDYYECQIVDIIEKYLSEKFSKLPNGDLLFELKDLDNDFYCKHWR